MTAKNQAITFPAGDAFVLHVPIKDAAKQIVNLAGHTVEYLVSDAPPESATEVLLTKTTANGEASLEEDEDGLWSADIVFNHVDTVSMAPKTYYHQLRVYDGSGAPSTVMTGSITIEPTLQPD